MTRNHALVTGGAGFIGSHLCEHLLQQDWRVTALDDLSTGSIRNIRHLEPNPDFRLVVGSAGNEELLERLLPETSLVFHLAAVVGVRKVMDDTVTTIEKNSHTTETVLRACARWHLRLLTASTSEVYGANPKPMFHEEDDAIIGNSRHRRWCYAAGKLLDEFHAYAYHDSKALPVTVVRLFNTIGPRQVGHYGMVVPSFVTQALRGAPLTIYGDGHQRRCFTNVRDVVRVLFDLGQRPEAVGRTYNIGSQEEVTIIELAERIIRMTGSGSGIVFQSYAEVFGEDFVDMERRVPDTGRLQALLGYVPDTPLETTLREVVDAMRDSTQEGCA